VHAPLPPDPKLAMAAACPAPPPANPSPCVPPRPLPRLMRSARRAVLAELPKPPSSPVDSSPSVLPHGSNTLSASPKHTAPSGFPSPPRLLHVPTPSHGHRRRHRSSSLLRRLLDLTTGSCPEAGGDGDSDAVGGVGMASVGAAEPSRGPSWSFSAPLPPAP
jgi:hypothetical protein